MGRRIGGKVNWLKVFNAVLERKMEGFFLGKERCKVQCFLSKQGS